MARQTTFYYSFLVLPREQRRAIIAVWDFCRAIDDSVDSVDALGDAAAGSRESIAHWRAELARCYGGGAPETPQGQRMKPFITEFDLPRQAFADVIDGVAMDLDKRRYETFDDLLQYCKRVASAVGMICIRIFGCQSPRAAEYALNLGVALQLTNIIRDVRDDLDMGRIYLPMKDLEATGCTIEDLQARRASDPVRRLLEFECHRARDFYQRAVEARPAEDRPKLVAAEIMRAVYFATLQRVEDRQYDVFAGRVRLRRPEQAVIALKQWLLPA